ncbi:MAG: lipoprotein [Methylococcaceae bacterium]|nr:lipoprotein [Methylococcaceae bacterium]
MKKLLFILILSLQACGQTGPLYLPDEDAPIHVPEEDS